MYDKDAKKTGMLQNLDFSMFINTRQTTIFSSSSKKIYLFPGSNDQWSEE